jgi:metallo-beta-lactamase family protein
MNRRKRWITALCLAAIICAAVVWRLFLFRTEEGPVLSFCGGAREVGGSCLLVETGEERFVVDCGALGSAGSGIIPPAPDSLLFAIITHAHLDHCGLLPELYAAGFRGKTYCTSPTAELVPVMLRMSRSFSPSKVSREAFDRALAGIASVPFGERVSEGSVSFAFRRAGHLLGAAFVEIEIGGARGTRLIVSGDLGSGNSLLLPGLEPPGPADYVVMESTYGGTERESVSQAGFQRFRPFADAVGSALGRGGDVLIPAFTLGRTQEVLAAIDLFKNEGVIPAGTIVYIDSPTANKITGIYRRFRGEASAWARDFYEGEILASTALREVRSRTSMKVHARRHDPAIFISSSGNLDHANSPRHLVELFDDERNLLCIVGWQSPGSLGGRILAGEDPVLVRRREGTNTLKEWISPALEVRSFDCFSGHADRAGLLAWLGGAEGVRRVFLVHGEYESACACADAIENELGIRAHVPEPGERIALRKSKQGP